MGLEEERLQSLCDLASRITQRYSTAGGSDPQTPAACTTQNACPSKGTAVVGNKLLSPRKRGCKVGANKDEGKTNNSSPRDKPSDIKAATASPAKSVSTQNSDQKLTQEEKQTLRKAKKEAKQQSKTVAKEAKVASAVPEVQKQPVDEQKSKSELRKERREKQEVQRAAKAKEVTKKATANSTEMQNVPQPPPAQEKPRPKKVSLKVPSKKSRRLPLLGHLERQMSQKISSSTEHIHPAVMAAGIRMKERVIDGCTACTIATLSAFRELIQDYQTPPSCDMHRDLATKVACNVAYLNDCRRMLEPIRNVIRVLKHKVNSLEDRPLPENQAKEELVSFIESYISNNIILASKTIVDHALEKVDEGDIIMTFGVSRIVYETLERAYHEGLNVSVIVVDVPHPATGVTMATKLVTLGVRTRHCLLMDVPHMIKKVNKVIVEAEAVVMNGAVVGPCGLSGLALMASYHSKPVIVLSHTYKFCNIDLTDSLVMNELGNADDVIHCSSSRFRNLLSNWKETDSLNVVCLIYDVMPAELVTLLVTELSALPTSVVPVIIKRNYADLMDQD